MAKFRCVTHIALCKTANHRAALYENKSRFSHNVEYGDIVKGLPVDYASCKGIYCFHVLEHLSPDNFRIALGNTYKFLQPGGVFRFVLPDLEYIAKQYIGNTSTEAASSFMRDTYLGLESRPRNLKGFIASWLGNSQHLWMWDYKSIKQELINAGFIEVRNAIYNDSSDVMFLDIEEKIRWDNCLGVECKKSLR